MSQRNFAVNSYTRHQQKSELFDIPAWGIDAQ